MITPFSQRVQSDIERHKLFETGDRILAAVSGGADSTALLLALQELAGELDVEIRAAHFDHRMRSDSGADADFVDDLCARLGVPLQIGASDKLDSSSSEDDARKERLAFLESAAKAMDCSVIATGHTADDRAETVLLNIVRGAGLRGARGMDWRRGQYRRALLRRTRREIVSFLHAHGQAWREDLSNTSPRYARNLLRLEVMPLIRKQINPALTTSLCRLADVASLEDDLLAEFGQKAYESALVEACEHLRALDASRLSTERPALARRAVRCALEGLLGHTRDVSLEMVDRCLAAAQRPESPPEDIGLGVSVSVDAGVLALSLALPEPEPFDYPLPGAGSLDIREAQITLFVNAEDVPDSAWKAQVRVADDNLRARSWRPGDRMRPRGLGGTKKLQDLFVDAKVPAEQRRRIPIVCAGETIVWVPGLCVAEDSGSRPVQLAAIEAQL
ncbi:MAG: tRNA lysidine(34) synthetase TilS [Armatimonadetes bacterium]|nr:tRNA lysidine(34) synthetase TilS [Armatimonadota bacterium]